MISRLVLLTFALSISGCAAHSSLVPVGEGRLAPNVSIGGPIVEAFGTHIPVPYLTLGAEYGLGERINAGGSVHMLALAYKVAGMDAALTWFPMLEAGARPTVGLGARLFAFSSIKSDVEQRFFVYPGLSGSAAWSLGNGMAYTGLDLSAPLTRPEYDRDAAHLIWSPFAGYRWNVGKRFALLTELKWHGANVATDHVAVEYISVGRWGALAPLIAFQRRF